MMEKKGITKQQFKEFVDKGISFNDYLKNFEIELHEKSLSHNDKYLPLNWQRIKRIEKTISLRDDIIDISGYIHHKIYWLVLCEHWCGDAAQSLPVFDAVAKATEGKIEIKILYRDENPALMDAYLTGESRSIPKLIQLDKNYSVTAIWGPRPNAAQKLVNSLKSNVVTSENYSEALHKWYATDRQQSLQNDVIKLLQKANLFCTDCIS